MINVIEKMGWVENKTVLEWLKDHNGQIEVLVYSHMGYTITARSHKLVKEKQTYGVAATRSDSAFRAATTTQLCFSLKMECTRPVSQPHNRLENLHQQNPWSVQLDSSVNKTSFSTYQSQPDASLLTRGVAKLQKGLYPVFQMSPLGDKGNDITIISQFIWPCQGWTPTSVKLHNHLKKCTQNWCCRDLFWNNLHTLQEWVHRASQHQSNCRCCRYTNLKLQIISSCKVARIKVNGGAHYNTDRWQYT